MSIDSYPWLEKYYQAIKLVNLPHAIIINGPKGVGKKILSREIARLIISNEEDITPEKEIEPEPIPQPEVILIEELQLPVRAYNCLKRAGINSVDELVKYSQEEIKEIKNFGKKSADEVFHALKKKFNIVLPSLKQ